MRDITVIEDEEKKVREELRQYEAEKLERIEELTREKRRCTTIVPSPAGGVCAACRAPFAMGRAVVVGLGAKPGGYGTTEHQGLCTDCVEAAHEVALSLRLAKAGG